MEQAEETKITMSTSDSDEPSTQQASLNGIKARIQKWNQVQHWRIFWLLPNLVPHPHQDDVLYHVEHDTKENEGTRVPEASELRVGMIWGVEFYGPSEIECLFAGLRNLGWKPVSGMREGTIQDWVQHQRDFGHGGWLNVGHVIDRKDKGKHFLTQNRSTMPEGVAGLVVQCHQVTPSLTALIVGFELNDSASRSYERELNQDRTTSFRRSDRRFAISSWTPEHQKREAVDKARSNLRSIVGSWFQENVPGFFCSLERPHAFPTMELLMVTEGPILAHPEGMPRETFFGWRRITTNTIPWDIWSCDEASGLQLTMNSSRDDAKGLHITLAIDKSKLLENDLEGWGGKTNSAISYKLNRETEGLLLHVASVQYLREQSRDIKLTRVGLKKARSGRSSVKRTLNMISLYFDRTLGSPAITRELAKSSERAGWYRRDFLKFTMPQRRDGGEVLDLSEEVRSSVHHLAIRQIEDEAAMRSHIEQISSVLSVRESVKAQHRMERLTWIAVLVAMASLLVALPNIGKLF